ncbi:MAG: lactate racemase domain-containing protein [Candidatus Bathyarchaeia archaeon]
MVEVWLPYGDTEVYISVDLKNFLGKLEPEDRSPNESPEKILSEALGGDGGKILEESTSAKSSTAIAVEGTTEPYISVKVLNELANGLGAHGVTKDKISIIIGNGTRQKSNMKLLNAIRNDEALADISLYEHGPESSDLTKLGSTSLGTPVSVNRHYADADLKIAVGEVWPDAYTGFTGAHTAVLPGISGFETIESSRLHYFKGKEPGVTQSNKLKDDALEAADIAGVDIALNLLVSTGGGLLDAYTGSLEGSWNSALESLDGCYELDTKERGDIVVASSGGRKRDFDLYHALWTLKTADKACKRNGTIILIAECIEGLGVESLNSMASIRQLDEFERRYRLGAEAVHLVKSLARSKRLILVSVLPDYLIESLGFETSRNANTAYEMALRGSKGKKTLVMPYGCFTLPS